MTTLNQAIAHVSTSVSLVNLLAVAEGNVELLSTHPRLRTGVRLYGEEYVIQACISLTKPTDVAVCEVKYEVSVVDIEELSEKVNSDIIQYTLTERTEEQKSNKEKYRIFRSIINWSYIVDAVEGMVGKGDKTALMAVLSIRNNFKKLNKDTLKEVYYLVKEVSGERAAQMFADGINNLKKIVDLKGSMSAINGVSFSSNSAGITVGLEGNKVKILLTADWFEQAKQLVVRRVRVQGVPSIDGTYLIKCALIVHSGISLDGMTRDDIFLATAFNETGTKLVPESKPTLKMDPSIVSKTGFIEPSKFNDGMFTFYPETPVQYPGLAEQHNGVFHSIADAKKFAARQEKLNKEREDAFKVTLHNVVFLKDVPENMNDLFNTGCFYMAAQDLLKYGVCRIVSNIHNGMLKGATNLATLVDSKLGVTHSFICASSYKGGLVGVMNVKGYQYDLNSTIEAPEGIWDKLVVNGVELDAVVASIEVMITNPYSLHAYTLKSQVEVSDIDSVDLETVEKLVEEYESEADSALAFEMLETVISKDSTVAKVIEEYKQYGLKLKKPFTTVVSSDFEAVRNTYGKEEATKLIDGLLKSPLNKATKTRKYAFDIIKGEFNVVNEITFSELVFKFLELKEMYSVVGNQYNSCNRNFLLLLVDAIGANRKGQGWVKVTHEDMGENYSVHLPIGTALYGDLLDTSETLDKVVVKKLLPALLTELEKVSKFKNIGNGVIEMFMKAMNLEVQWAFINKDFGRLKTPGKYFVALPGTWLENKFDVCLPGRDIYAPKKSDKKFVKANVGKQPIIFHGSFAGCRVFKDIPMFESLHPELREVLSCAVFVHPEYLLELQNDADGDLVRISFENHVLPFYDSGVLEQEGKVFFQNYIAGEKDFAVGNTQGVKSFNAMDLQMAISDAVVSKERVGAYTDRMHVIATHIDSVVGDKISEEMRQAIVRFYGILIQECAMNAIKHNSNGDGLTVADSLSKFFLAQTDKKTGVNIGIPRAKKMVLEFLTEEEFDFGMFGYTLEEATGIIVAATKAINEQYDVQSAEMHRRLFKNRPYANGEYITFLGSELEGSEDSTFSVLYSALLASV